MNYKRIGIINICFLLSVVFTLLDLYQDGFWIIIPVISLILWDKKESVVQNVISYLKCNYLIVIISIITSLVMAFILHPNNISWRMPLMVITIIYLGYIYSIDIDISKKSLCDLSKIMFVITVIGLIWYIKGVNYSANFFSGAQSYFQSYPTRLFAIYNHPLPASCIIMISIILAFYLIDNVILKSIMILLSYIALLFTVSRSTIILTSLALLVIAIKRLIDIKRNENITITSKHIFIIIIMAIVVFVIAAIWGYKYVGYFISRFSNLNLNDVGIGNRILNYKLFFTNMIWDGNILNKLFGRGVLSGYYRLVEIKNSMGIDYGPQYTGPLENSFMSITYDFGIIFGLLYIWSFIKSIILLIKSKIDLDKAISLCYICLFIMSMTFDMVYWINVFYLQLLFGGMIITRCKIIISYD